MATNVTVTIPPTDGVPSSGGFSPTMISSPTSVPNSNNGLGISGVNYFFGFLVAFTALLLFVVGCGFCLTRRRARIRQLQQRLENTDRSESTIFYTGGEDGVGRMLLLRDCQEDVVKEPLLWDKGIEKADKEVWEWDSMMPLSAVVVPEGIDAAPPKPLYTPQTVNWLRPRTPEPRSNRRSIASAIMTPFTVTFMGNLHRRSRSRSDATELATASTTGAEGAGEEVGELSRTVSRQSRHTTRTADTTHTTQTADTDPVPSVIPFIHRIPSRPSSTTAEKEADADSVKIMDIQVVVMITMPSPHDAKHHHGEEEQEEEGRLPEVQLGVARVPVLSDDPCAL